MLTLLCTLALSVSLVADEPVTLPMGRTPAGHDTLDVKITGAPARPFLFDTAASHMGVISAVAERFGFVSRMDELHAIQTVNEEITAARFRIGPLTIAPHVVPGVKAVAVPVAPDKDLSVAGLIGADAFHDQTLHADLPLGRMTLNAAPPRHADGVIDPESAVLVGLARVARVRRPAMTLVDTGSARTIVNSEVADLMPRRQPAVRVPLGGVSRAAAQETEEAGLVLIERIRIGGICVGPLLAVKADVDVFRAMGWAERPAMILGVDALQSAALTIDYENRTFELGGGEPDCRSRRMQLGTRS